MSRANINPLQKEGKKIERKSLSNGSLQKSNSDLHKLSRRSWQKVEIDESGKIQVSKPNKRQKKTAATMRKHTTSFQTLLHGTKDMETIKLKISIGGTEQKQFNVTSSETIEPISIRVPREIFDEDKTHYQQITTNNNNNNSNTAATTKTTKLGKKSRNEILWRIYDDPYYQNAAFDTLLAESATGVENFELLETRDAKGEKIIEVKKRTIKITRETKEVFLVFILCSLVFGSWIIYTITTPVKDQTKFNKCNLAMPNWFQPLFSNPDKDHIIQLKCNQVMYLFHNIYVSIGFYTGFLFLAGLRELYGHKCNGKRRRLYLNASQKSINTRIDCILVILGIIQLILYGNHVDNSNLYLKNTKLEHGEFIVQFVIDCIFGLIFVYQFYMAKYMNVRYISYMSQFPNIIAVLSITSSIIHLTYCLDNLYEETGPYSLSFLRTYYYSVSFKRLLNDKTIRHRLYLDSDIIKQLIQASWNIIEFVIVMAGMIQMLEGIDEEESYFESIGVSMYFIFVTMSTVGYGDILPLTFTGRLFTIFLIFAGIIKFAIETKTLQDIYEKDNKGQGSAPISFAHCKRALLVGDISSESLRHFLANFFHPSIKSSAAYRVIVMVEPIYYSKSDHDFLRQHPLYKYHVVYLVGNVTKDEDLERCMLDIFTPVFIVSDPSQDIADSGNVVRVMAIQKYRKQRGNIFAVVQQKSSINHLKVAGLSPWSAAALDDTKMELLAKSVVCPGIIPLVFNLLLPTSGNISEPETQESLLEIEGIEDADNFFVATDSNDGDLQGDEDIGLVAWEKEYIYGLEQDMMQIDVPNMVEGIEFFKAVIMLRKETSGHLCLIGLFDTEKQRHVFVPSHQTTNIEKNKHKCLIIVREKSCLKKLYQDDENVNNANYITSLISKQHSHYCSVSRKLDQQESNNVNRGRQRGSSTFDTIDYKESAVNLLEKEIEQDEKKIYKEITQEVIQEMVERAVSSIIKAGLDWTERLFVDVGASSGGKYSSLSHTASKLFKLRDPTPPHIPETGLKDHVIIIGENFDPSSFKAFVANLQSKRQKAKRKVKDIVILSRFEQRKSLWRLILIHYKNVYYVQGDFTQPQDLLRAGVMTASNVFLLADPSENEDGPITDSNAANDAVHLDKARIFSTLMLEGALKALGNDRLEIGIITEFMDLQNLNYMLTKARYDVWPRYASGRIYPASTLISLLSQAYYQPHIFGILNSLISVEDGFSKQSPGTIVQTDIPSSFFINKIATMEEKDYDADFLYNDLFEYIVNEFKCLPIGLYRGSKLNAAGHRVSNESSTAYLPYTYTNPVYNCPLHVENHVLHKNLDLSKFNLKIEEDQIEFSGHIPLIEESFSVNDLVELDFYNHNTKTRTKHIYSIRKVRKTMMGVITSHNNNNSNSDMENESKDSPMKTILYTKFKSGDIQKYNAGNVTISRLCYFDRLFIMGRSSALQKLYYDESGSDTKFIQKIAAIKRIQLHRKKLKAKRASIILMAEKKEKEILAKKGKITTTKNKAPIHKSHSSVK